MGRLLNALIGPPEPPRPTVEARAGSVALAPGGSTPAGRLPWGRGPGLAPIEWGGAAVPWWDRTAAMSLPTISRARDLICSAVAALPFTTWQVDNNATPAVERQRPDLTWTRRPDPDRTRQWLLAWTTDDLFFYGEAHWYITARYAGADDYPRAFQRITPGDLVVDNNGATTVNGTRIDPRDIVEFLSPIEGLLSNGYRALSIAVALDDAADRFAGTEIPSGVLQEQAGGEDMSADDLAQLAATFTEARRSNTTAALNKYVQYSPTTVDASAMQLVEGRTYQALEMARLANVPPYLVGAPAGTGMTYQNAEQARGDLIDFGCLPYIGCIEQTLSGPNVCAGGTSVRLETNAWLRSPFNGDPSPSPGPNDMQIADQSGRPV
jgi:phage portal protein BeeE